MSGNALPSTPLDRTIGVMATSQSLPIIMPDLGDQRWSCHSCGDCCRSLVGHLFDEDRIRLDEQGWRDRLDVAPYVRVGRGWALNKRDDGACVFLDADNRCRIHSEFDESAKPLACRIFPFFVRAVPEGWQVSLRFDCPSVTSSKGRPIRQQRAGIRRIVRNLNHATPKDSQAPMLADRSRATVEELDLLWSRLRRWLDDSTIEPQTRWLGLARLAHTLSELKLTDVRGVRFGELLDLLVGALGSEDSIEAPTALQQGMLRQLVFAHAEHVTMHERRAGFLSKFKLRRRQLSTAGRFRRGRGPVPTLPGFEGDTTFRDVEAIAELESDRGPVADLMQRYLTARIEGQSICGAGYYGWSVFGGLSALCLAMASIGWLARLSAALDKRDRFTFEDVARALRVVDRAATRLPALGSVAERARVTYLLRDDGIVRLVAHYSILGARP